MYKHVRDDLLTIHGTTKYPPCVQDYRYGSLDCGNHEQSIGTPAEHVGNYEAYKKACEAAGVDCSPDWTTTDNTDEEGCEWAAYLEHV